MIDNRDSLLVLQRSLDWKNDTSKHRNSVKGSPLAAEQYIQDDKEALGHLLKVGVADSLAQGKTVDLDTNEEIPRLIPIICTYFSREELTQLLGEQVTAATLTMHRTEVLQNLFLERALQEVLHSFNEAKIPLMLFKGPALAYQFYPQPHLRTYHDIDTLIQPGDLARAHELLIQQGFTFYEEFRSNATDTTRTGYNYLLKQTDSWLEFQLELHTAPHPSEIGTSFNVQSLWERAQSMTLQGEPALTMHYIDHLLYLCWHYRFHGFTRLLWLYDMVVLLRTMQAEMDWPALVKLAREQKLVTTLYYCLVWCHDLFHIEIPENVFRQLRPPLLSRFLVERLAMPDVARALASSRWQAQRIIARRAMVDSSTDLLKAGLRALFPSKAMIGRRYMGHSRLPLQFFFIFYLIHPILTLGKGLGFLLRKMFSRQIA